MSAKQIHPSADVIWWTDTKLCVKCPYCEEFHYHGFVSYQSALRKPHCAMPRPSYWLRFPDAYEIDKPNARFINIDTPEELKSESESGTEVWTGLSRGISNMNLSTTPNGPQQSEVTLGNSHEQSILRLKGEEPFDESRIRLAISGCVQGKVPRVRSYLETASEKSIFLYGKNHKGDTCLIMASQQENPAMISLLLDHGAEINAANNNGRTALMEASLWGRLESAMILISRGADQNLYDEKRQRALGLTKPTHANRKERHEVAGGIWASKETIYKEDFFNRDSDRSRIRRVLRRGECARADLEPQESETPRYSFRRCLDSQSVFCDGGSIPKYSISNSTKTVAVLERSRPFPSISAMSGWKHLSWPSITLSGGFWTSMVLKLAAIVGHNLSADAAKDRGAPGRFQACHAEKQLIAYFVDQHVFSPQDKVSNPQFDKIIKNHESEIKNLEIQYSSSIRQMYRLQDDMEKIEIELWDKDDRLLGDEYDEEAMKGLKAKKASLGEEIAVLERLPELKRLRNLEYRIEGMEYKKSLHERLIRMSANEPESTLRRATILISAPTHKICQDCSSFKDSVNDFFGLQIKLRECTK